MNIMEGTSAIMAVLVFLFLIAFSAKTQLTSLMERYREVGILKSLGWSNNRLGRQVVLISLVQSLIGASAGILAGLVLIFFLNRYQVRLFSAMEFHFQPASLPLLILLPLAGALIAAVFPVIKLYRTRAGDMINNFM